MSKPIFKGDCTFIINDECADITNNFQLGLNNYKLNKDRVSGLWMHVDTGGEIQGIVGGYYDNLLDHFVVSI